MRESYRDKQNRKARIQREKESMQDRRKSERRDSERRQAERRVSDRRVENRPFNGPDRRNAQRRAEQDRRTSERRLEDRRSEENIDNEYEDIVAGRNAVLELLKSDKDINKIFIESLLYSQHYAYQLNFSYY